MKPTATIETLIYSLLIILGLFIVFLYFQAKKQRDLEKNKYPKTRPVKYSKEVERLLEVEDRLDEFERKIS